MKIKIIAIPILLLLSINLTVNKLNATEYIIPLDKKHYEGYLKIENKQESVEQERFMKKDFQTEGDGKIIKDNTTGLEWMSLDVTLNKTINESLSLYGTYGFRVANKEEVQVILSTIFKEIDFSKGTVQINENEYPEESNEFKSIFGGLYVGLHNTPEGVAASGLLRKSDGLLYINNNANIGVYHNDWRYPRDAVFLVKN